MCRSGIALALLLLTACGKSPEQGSTPAPKDNEEVVLINVTGMT